MVYAAAIVLTELLSLAATLQWWKKVEVYVHALSAVSKSIREEDTSLIPQLFEYLSRKEPSHPALSRTVTIFLGVMGHWFARNPSYLAVYAFRIISQSFEMSESHPSYPFRMRLHGEDHVGTVALKKLTQRCGAYFFNQPWLDAMLGLYRTSRAPLPAGKKPSLTGNSVVMVVESVANVVASVPYKDAAPVVEQLCALMFLDLTTRFPVLSAADDASVEFLCEVFEHLHVLAAKIPPQINQDVPHPVLCVLRTHWDGIEGILREYGANEEVMSRFSALLVALFESIRAQALELASAIMPHVLEQFARSFDGSFLAVIKSIIACAGDDDESAASLTRVVVIVCESALAHIAAAGGSVDAHAALIVSLLDLARCCGAHRPLILAQSNQLESLLALVLHALKAQNPDVGFAALDFLSDVGSWYGEVLRIPADQLRSGAFEGQLQLHELIRTLFFEKDVQYQLLVALFHAAGGSMPPALLERVAEVVRSCWACFGRQRSEELIQRLLADDAFVGSRVAVRARAEFAGTIAKPECIENSRKFKRVLTAFCDHFRKSLTGSTAVRTAAVGSTGVVSS